jgi:hypothetical protein
VKELKKLRGGWMKLKTCNLSQTSRIVILDFKHGSPNQHDVHH